MYHVRNMIAWIEIRIRNLGRGTISFSKSLYDKMLKAIHGLGRVISLMFQSIWFSLLPPYRPRRVIHYMRTIGADSLPVVFVVSLSIGAAFALQSAYLMSRFGMKYYIGSIVGQVMTREIGPVITAIIVTARVGAAMAAEIGSMNVMEQVNALRTLSTSPVRYLVKPRLIAMVWTLPMLVVLSGFIGIYGGWLVCKIQRFNLTGEQYKLLTAQFLSARDIWSGVYKALVFAVFIVIISCYQGLSTRGGAEGVGKSTTKAVVQASVAILIADYVLTTLFYYVL